MSRKRKSSRYKPPRRKLRPTSSTHIKNARRKFTKIQKWFLGTIFGLIVLAVIGNHISAIIPNPFQYIFSRVKPASQEKKPMTWFAGGIKNTLTHNLNFGVWNYSEAVWGVDTIQPGETKWYSDTGVLYMNIKGDSILEEYPRIRMTQTYKGSECYELESYTFDHQPDDAELRSCPINKISQVLGGPSPKVINFADGTTITFDVFGPTGIRLKTLLPVISEGQGIYPFQIPNEKK